MAHSYIGLPVVLGSCHHNAGAPSSKFPCQEGFMILTYVLTSLISAAVIVKCR